MLSRQSGNLRSSCKIFDSETETKMESATTITIKITDDFVCPECHQIFDRPKVLPCGHSVCLKCLREKCAEKPLSKNKVACPKCECKVTVPNSGRAEDYPDNFSLISVLNILQLTTKSETIENRKCGNGTLKRLDQADRQRQRFGQMQTQLDKDFIEITNIIETAKTAVQNLTQSKSYLDKQIKEAAESFLEKITKDTETKKQELLESVEITFNEKAKEVSATLEKAKVLEATIFSAREVTSSILAAIQREDTDLKAGVDIGVKVEGLVQNVNRKMIDIRKRKIYDVLGVRFQPEALEKTPSFGHLPDILLFVGVLWLNKNELLLVADRRKGKNCVIFRCVNSNDVMKILWEGNINPKDRDAPISSMTSPFRTGNILISVGNEVFILGTESKHSSSAPSITVETVLSLDIPHSTYITSLTVRHDGSIMVGTNLSNMILTFSEKGESRDVIDVLAEEDVMHPVSMCSISYYRTAVCCMSAEKVIVLSHSWNAAKTKRAGYLTLEKECPNGPATDYVCKSVKSSLSGWLVLWITSDLNNNDNPAESHVLWEVVCYEYVTPLGSLIAKGDSRETGIPVGMDVREKQLAMCFPDGRVQFYEV